MLTVKQGYITLCENVVTDLTIENDRVGMYLFQWHLDKVKSHLKSDELNDIINNCLDIGTIYNMTFIETGTGNEYKSQVFIDKVDYPNDKNDGIMLTFQGAKALGDFNDV